MELDLQSIFGLHEHSCTHCLRLRNSSPPPAFGLIYEGVNGQFHTKNDEFTVMLFSTVKEPTGPEIAPVGINIKIYYVSLVSPKHCAFKNCVISQTYVTQSVVFEVIFIRITHAI